TPITDAGRSRPLHTSGGGSDAAVRRLTEATASEMDRAGAARRDPIPVPARALALLPACWRAGPGNRAQEEAPMATVPSRRSLPVLRGRAGRSFPAMALAAAGAACSESPLDPLVEHGAPGSLKTAGRMPPPELRAAQVSASGVVVRWTEVDAGT